MNTRTAGRRHISLLPVLVRTALVLALLAAAPVTTLVRPAIAGAAPTISVRDFGARGDGATDDSAAIQAAISSVPGPKTVWFPAGTYVFSNVYLSNDTNLVFESGAKALSPLNATSDQVFFAAIGTASARKRNVSLSGGAFEGRPTIGGVLVAQNVDGVRVDRVYSNHTERCVGTQESRDVVVTNSLARNGLQAFAFQRSERITVSGVTAEDMRRDGIIFYDRSRLVTATANRIERYSTGYRTGWAGIHMYGSTEGTITGNLLVDGRGDSSAIRFRDSNVFWCEGNRVVSPGSDGLTVVRIGDFPGLDGGNGTFIRNVVIGARSRGIDVSSAGCKPVNVIDNVVRDTTSKDTINQGVGINALANYCRIVGNEVVNSTGAGINIGGAGQLVAFNTVRNPASVNFGPRVAVCATGTNHKIVGNRLLDEKRQMVNGVRLMPYSSAVLRTNVIVGQTGGAYDIRGTSLLSVNSDVEPPTVASLAKAPVANTRSVQLAASDTRSTVAAIRFAVDGAPAGTVLGSKATTEVVGVGVHDVTYDAIDDSGNVRTASVYMGGEATSMSLLSAPQSAAQPFGTTITMKGALLNAAGAPMPGRTVALQEWNAVLFAWTSTGATATTDASGTWTFTRQLQRSVKYRTSYPGTSDRYYPSSTPAAIFAIRAYLNRPTCASSGSGGIYYWYKGTIKPRHLAGSAVVRLQFYRKENTRWVLRKSVWAKASNYYGYSLYSVKTPLPRGSWAVRAYHSDADHAPTTSTFSYVRMR